MNKEHRIMNNDINLSLLNSKFNIRYSILIFLLITSACSNPYKDLTKTEYSVSDIQQIPFTLPFSEKVLIFKTNINFYKNDISGLLIIKKTKDNIYRIVLTTQFGLKIFDFELNHGVLNVNHCIEYLNKKVIINTLQTDFNLLLMQNKTEAIYFIENIDLNQNIWKFTSGKINHYYIQDTESGKIENISSKKRNSEKISIDLYNYKENIPGNIILEHRNIKLKMNLKLIQQ
ncbi:MAG: hypothetical protein PF485_04330 [Bacteroidales bacterium]|nr:hypothetical protein [Bacteroidales bacterium]